MEKQKSEYVIENGPNKFIFICDRGSKRELMSHMLDMIFDDKIDFEWSDAVGVAFGIIDDLLREIEADRYLSNPP